MKIVFTHIEKTAGTSFRVYLYSMFRQEQLFWFQEPAQPFPDKDYFLYGGHRTVAAFDAAVPDSILLSILRDPVDRVVSLHRYISKQIADRARPGRLDDYVAIGFDPGSMSRSLANCEDFRRRSHNVQALALCGGEGRADDADLADRALEYLRSRPCVIGLQGRLDTFLLRLVDHWGWSTLFPVENASKGFSQMTGLYADPAERAVVESLCDQDVHLYRALFPTLGLTTVTYAQSCRVVMPRGILPEMRKKLAIDAVNTGLVVYRLAETAPGRQVEIPVRIVNRGLLPFGPTSGYRINISYHVRTVGGEMAIYDGARTELTTTIMPGVAGFAVAKLVLPETPGHYTVEPAVVIEELAWIDAAGGAETTSFNIEVRE